MTRRNWACANAGCVSVRLLVVVTPNGGLGLKPRAAQRAIVMDWTLPHRRPSIGVVVTLDVTSPGDRGEFPGVRHLSGQTVSALSGCGWGGSQEFPQGGTRVDATVQAQVRAGD